MDVVGQNDGAQLRFSTNREVITVAAIYARAAEEVAAGSFKGTLPPGYDAPTLRRCALEAEAVLPEYERVEACFGVERARELYAIGNIVCPSFPAEKQRAVRGLLRALALTLPSRPLGKEKT